MTAALRIALKDLHQRVRDRSAFLWGFVAPVGLAFIFGLVLGNVTDGGSIDLRFGLVDADGGAAAQAFVDQGLQPLVDQGLIQDLIPFGDVADAEQAVTEGLVDALFVIPAGFTEAAFGGGTTAIEVVGNVDSTIGSQVARAIAGRMVGEINGIRTAVATVCYREGLDAAACSTADLATAAQQTAVPLVTDTLETTNTQLDGGTFYSAGMAVMFLFLTVQFGVLGLLEEKTNGTMRRLLAAPISRWSIVAGKALTSFVLGIVSMAAIIVATSLIPALSADWGNPLSVAVLVLAGVASAMGVMMLIATWARTPEQAQNLQAIVAFLLAMVGGVFFPVGNVGGIVGVLAKGAPHYWFMRGLGDAAGGTGFGAVMGSVWPILVFAAATIGLASLRLRRTVTP